MSTRVDCAGGRSTCIEYSVFTAIEELLVHFDLTRPLDLTTYVIYDYIMTSVCHWVEDVETGKYFLNALRFVY
jgi:hypothetical protein